MTTERTGCARGCALFAAGVAVLVVGIILLGYVFGDRTAEATVRVTGTVHVSIPSACESPELDIRPEGKAWRTVRFEASSWRAGQTCTLPLSVELPAADRYTIRMEGVGIETVARAAGTTTVRIDISW